MYNRELKIKLLELSQTWSIISVTLPKSVTHIGKDAFPPHTQIIRK